MDTTLLRGSRTSCQKSVCDSKQLCMLTLTVEHNYICYYIIGVYNNDMFRPYMWAVVRLTAYAILACV